MRLGGIFISLILLSVSAGAQQNGNFADCYSRAENNYMLYSQSNISLYDSTRIDRFEFEKNRTVIANRRESELRLCSDKENQNLRSQVRVLNDRLETTQPTSGRRPASFNPAYEEIQSTDDTNE